MQVHLLDALWWSKVFANTISLKVANSRSLSPLLFASLLQTGPQMPYQFSKASLPTNAFQSPCSFRAGRSTTEQIFNLRILWEISPAPARLLPCLCGLQKGLRHGLACSFVGNHEENNISTSLIQVIKHLCDKSTSAVLFCSGIGDWFGTIVQSDRNVCSHPPSSTYFKKGSWQTA